MLVFRPDSRPEHWQFWTREHFFDLSERHRLERQPVEKTLEEIQEFHDPRMAEAIDLLRSKQQPEGWWLLENTHPGAIHFALA